MEAPPFPLSSRPKRSEVEGSAVPRTSRRNAYWVAKSGGFTAVVSYISQKTSEIWGTRGPRQGQRLRSLFRRTPATPFAGRILIRIRSLLRRPHLFRHMTQVNADPGPSRRSTAHGVNQHIIHSQKRSHLGMLRLPPLQPRQRILFARRVRNHQQRHLSARRPLGARLRT